MEIYYVVQDYFESLGCMNAWGNVFLPVASDGALHCHSAATLPFEFPHVRDSDVARSGATRKPSTDSAGSGG